MEPDTTARLSTKTRLVRSDWLQVKGAPRPLPRDRTEISKSLPRGFSEGQLWYDYTIPIEGLRRAPSRRGAERVTSPVSRYSEVSFAGACSPYLQRLTSRVAYQYRLRPEEVPDLL